MKLYYHSSYFGGLWMWCRGTGRWPFRM